MTDHTDMEGGAAVRRVRSTEQISRSLWRRYIFAVLIIAVSLIVSHGASMKAIQRTYDAGTAIKLAANQRMLSQRIMFLATDAVLAYDLEGNEAPTTELQQAIDQFEDTHYALMWGGKMGLTEEGADQRRYIFSQVIDDRSLSVLIPAFIDLGKYVQTGTFENRMWALERMQDFGQNMLLSRLEVAVEGMEQEAKVVVNRMRYLSWVSLGVALFILAAEIVLIFRPAHVLVRKALRDLDESQTEQNLARQRAERAQAEAQAALATQSRFFGYMSHELRTPLNGIIGMLSLIQEDVPKKDRKRYLFHASAAAEHLLTMLSNVLDLSRLETGMMSVENAPFDPGETIELATQFFEGQADAKRVALRFACSDTVPDQIRGDRARVLQVATNLIGNAVKFTDEGSVEVSLTTDTDAEPPRLVVDVRDTGPGLDPAIIPNLFDDFVTSKLTAEKSVLGSGLGLSISRQLVEKMGGEIEARNRAGAGSLFRFSIPIDVVKVHAKADTQPVERSKDAPVFDRRHVLVVDDNEANRLVAQAYVKSLGGTVSFAENGQVAVDMLADAGSDQGAIDLILMDQRMPVMDGLQATRRIREISGRLGQHIPILMSSANISQEDQENAFEAGANGFLPKPLRRDALIAAACAQFDTAQSTETASDEAA